MKRTVPLLITAVVGFVLVCSVFVPAAESWGEKAYMWFDMLAGIAFLLGGANLVGSQLKKISTRRKGWGYAAVTLVAFLLTLTVGLLKAGSRPAVNQEFYGQTFVPLAATALPVISVDNGDPEMTGPVPPSVRRQVTLSKDKIEVRGWLSSTQVADLSDAKATLNWQCGIEKLALAAQPPAAFRGRLSYLADHGRLSFRGVMTEAEQSELKAAFPQSPDLQKAIDELGPLTRRVTKVTAPDPPPAFEMPASLAMRVTIDNGSLSIIGPVSAGDRAALSRGALRARIAFPMSSREEDELIQELSSAGPLSDSQKTSLQRIVRKNWSDELIAAVNSAGAAKPGTKTACELVAERNAGAKSLDPVIPAGKSVTLSDEQKDAIRAFAAGTLGDWTALADRLKSAGELTEAQTGAIEEFRQSLPTIGARNRQLFDELRLGGALTSAQRERLLRDYRVEANWAAAVSRLSLASHQLKYPWSGEVNQQGTPFWWLFEYIYQPIQSMMFALLAFYVASAAFRAFRAKNFEAILLLGTAFIILLGRTYYGSLVTAWLPPDNPLRLENLSLDIMRVFNTAGNRAIMIGIALGIASTSLKVLLGIDRSHTGGKG